MERSQNSSQIPVTVTLMERLSKQGPYCAQVQILAASVGPGSFPECACMQHSCVVCALPLLSVFLCDIHCREFGRWKVNSLALERQENNGFSLPLDPEFLQTIRQLGRRPSLSAITDNIIRKYGTHFLLSATLGGK